MKIDLNGSSEVLGTFLVRKGGVVTGLKKHEGKKVMVILLKKG